MPVSQGRLPAYDVSVVPIHVAPPPLGVLVAQTPVELGDHREGVEVDVHEDHPATEPTADLTLALLHNPPLPNPPPP